MVGLKRTKDEINGFHQEAADVGQARRRSLGSGDEIVNKEIDRGQSTAIDSLERIGDARERGLGGAGGLLSRRQGDHVS
eukprot:scaffold23366_cov215-Cylindrotheca_fusiformis.AAC.5